MFPSARVKRQHRPRQVAIWLTLATVCLALLGCQQKMVDQPRYEPLEASDFFDDGRASRPLPADTVARGEIVGDSVFTSGRENGELVQTLPIAVDEALLERGRERYDIFCSPCHGLVGNGDGMIVQRGYPQPPSFHSERLRQQPDGYYFDVITNGFGVMFSYASRVPVEDRWAIVAYIRTLQLSQNVTTEQLPATDVEQLP